MLGAAPAAGCADWLFAVQRELVLKAAGVRGIRARAVGVPVLPDQRLRCGRSDAPMGELLVAPIGTRSLPLGIRIIPSLPLNAGLAIGGPTMRLTEASVGSR